MATQKQIDSWKRKSEMMKKNHPRYWLGKKHSEETREKMSLIKKGYIPWKAIYRSAEVNTGKKITNPVILKKISDSHRGERNYRWKGGDLTRSVRRAFYERHRNYLKKSSTGRHSFEEWESLKKKYNYMCLCCKRTEPEIKLTEDHIIPISKGGGNSIDNIQPLCLSCNCKKLTSKTDYRTLSNTQKS